jgi:pyridoxamine 5'-phosphate oxidase
MRGSCCCAVWTMRGWCSTRTPTARRAGSSRIDPYATLVFWWGALERQIRLRGRIEPVSDAEADAYFARRPRGHQLAAWVSPQSEPIPSRAWLEQRAAEVEREFEGREVPRPPYWTGYKLIPDAIEFWQGRRNRLHDRILFTRQPDGSWERVRLAP